MMAFLARVLFDPASRAGGVGGTVLSALARLLFASVLSRFFLDSFLTKLDGFGLSSGAYYQILPRQFEAAGYDASQLGLLLHLVVIAGAAAELVLPILFVLGLATRPVALAMMGFLLVMSLTDIYGHGVDAATIGLPFDADPYGKILDQRLLWAFLLAVPLVLGGGTLSLDRLVWSRLPMRFRRT